MLSARASVEAAFYDRQDARNAEHIASGNETASVIAPTPANSNPTTTRSGTSSKQYYRYSSLLQPYDPLGIAAGLSVTANAALNPADPDL